MSLYYTQMSFASGYPYQFSAEVDSMDPVNKTLYIPLFGKALVSRMGILLHDSKAEAIWGKEGFPLKGKAASKWLAYYMAMRARVFDRWLEEKMNEHPHRVILHLGCGMDSRIERVGNREQLWFDVDFPEVIAQREKHFAPQEYYRMLAGDARQTDWLESIPGGQGAIVVMEGISMYLKPEELSALLKALRDHFGDVALLMDCYTTFAAKASRYKNPINEVGVSTVYGLDDPYPLERTGLTYLSQMDMTPEDLIRELPKKDQWLFRKLYAGSMSKKLYRLHEFGSNR